MEERDIKKQRTALIIVSVLLFLAIVAIIILLVRNNRLMDTRDQALSRVQTTQAQWEEQSKQLQTMENQLQALRTEKEEVEAKLRAELESREAQLAQSTRRSRSMNQDIQALQERNQELEEQINNLESEIQTAKEELEKTSSQLSEQQKFVQVRGDSINMARNLRVYNIFPVTKWNRWIFSDQYHVEKARRVDELHVSFEVAGTVFSPRGTRQIQMVITDPEGNVLKGEGNEFKNQQTDETMAYTRQTEIEFESEPVPVDFIIEDPEMQAGEYQIQVFIDGRPSRTRNITLE